MNDRHDDFFDFIVILIKNADENDIRQLLINSGIKYIESTNISYKSVLLEKLLCGKYNESKIAEFNIEKGQNQKIEDYKYRLLFLHLLSLCENYYTYAIKYKANTYIKSVLHILIDNYTKNHFYYEYAGKIFRTKEIVGSYSKLPHTETVEYKIVNKDNKSKLINKETKKNINLNYLLPNVYKDNKGNELQDMVTFEAFNKINADIINALKREIIICSWCTPIDEFNAKFKCDDCKNLLSELNNLKSKLDDDKLKKVNFNNIIKSITLKKCNNDIQDCKKQRKQALLKYIDDIKRTTQKYKKDVKSIQNLIKKSFEE